MVKNPCFVKPETLDFHSWLKIWHNTEKWLVKSFVILMNKGLDKSFMKRVS